MDMGFIETLVGKLYQKFLSDFILKALRGRSLQPTVIDMFQLNLLNLYRPNRLSKTCLVEEVTPQ
jgi:hypothetical protein